jgi:hypothetical protein
MQSNGMVLIRMELIPLIKIQIDQEMNTEGEYLKYNKENIS